MPSSSSSNSRPGVPPDVIAALEDALGRDRIERNEASCVFFSTDLSRSGVAAAAIARPGTTDEVGAIFRICAQAQVSVVPRGGGFCPLICCFFSERVSKKAYRDTQNTTLTAAGRP